MLDSFYDELLPLALSCGMSYEEFWNEEPRLFSCYIKKREIELDNINYQSWLIGLYTYKAFGTVLNNVFSDKSSIKDTYFERPLGELNSDGEELKKQKETTVKTSYRQQVNYWAKFGKKGV